MKFLGLCLMKFPIAAWRRQSWISSYRSIYIYIYMYIYIHIAIYICIYIHYVITYICIYLYYILYIKYITCICIYILYIYIYVLYICVYIYIYIYILRDYSSVKISFNVINKRHTWSLLFHSDLKLCGNYVWIWIE